MSKNPSLRFESGREFLDALKAYQTTPQAAMPTAGRQPHGSRAVRFTALAAALVFCAVGLYSIRGRLSGVERGNIVSVGSVSHVLWVDDNPGNNSEVVGQLESRGVRVAIALSTAEALRKYDPAVHHFVVSDMGRFEGTSNTYVERAGLDMLNRLRAEDPNVQLVFCTSARATSTYREEAMAAGARAIVEDCEEVLRFMGF
jgi:CheY-like chemotaxis protein